MLNPRIHTGHHTQQHVCVMYQFNAIHTASMRTTFVNRAAACFTVMKRL